MVNKADPSVFVSADDVRDGGGVPADSPRLSTGSSGKPSSLDTSNEKTASVAFADSADDQQRSNKVFVVDDQL